MNPTRLLPTLLLIGACKGSDSTPLNTPPPPPTATIVFPSATLTAEIAATAAARAQGLMGRTTLAADAGMLFAYAADQSPQLVGFYMKDTPIDLSIAFLDANKRVLNVDEMTKNSLNTHVATGSFRYAIEANAGWFAAHGVGAGAIANFSLPAGTVVAP